MNTPVFLLGAAIAFWGWQTGQWVVAAACVLVFEGARFIPQRLELSSERLSRISDFCIVLACVLFAGFYVTLGNPQAITQLFLWMPLAWMPLALAQAYGTQREIELGVLFWSMRKTSRRRPTYVNIGYAYATAWIIAASAANRRDGLFELGVAALATWGLWQVRPRSRSVVLWLLLIPFAVAVSYAGHNGLHNAQLWLEANAADWLRGDGGSNTDPYRADTDIGHIGELKQSERIVMRVHTDTILPRSLLLHRASYVSYTGLRWLAKHAPFTPVVPGDTPGLWPLEPDREGLSMQWASIIEQTNLPNPVLSLPAGTRRVEGLMAGEMKRNMLGAVQVEHGPGFVAYRAVYVPGAAGAGAPGPDDLIVPRREAETLQRIVEALQLKTMAPDAALSAVERYFSEQFRYSLYQKDERGSVTPLTDFLLRTHAGHCEYFATATVLLLRAAGIPARYATGFSVQEWSEFESAYLVRERHAHAWARVWIDGEWRDVDTTPASWALIEAQATPWGSQIWDIASWLRLKFAELQLREGELPSAWIALGALLLLWVVWRVYGTSERLTPTTRQRRPAVVSLAPGTNSAFYRIEQALGERCSKRARDETIREWWLRIAANVSDLPARDELAALMELHYRCRFDPAGVSQAQLDELSARVDAWLAQAMTTA